LTAVGSESSAPVGMALALGALTVATNIRISEPAGTSRDRMARAVDSLADSARKDTHEIVIGDLISTFSQALASTSERDRRALLIELTVANPFSPYWFPMNDRRHGSRLRALKLVAALSLNLEPDSVAIIDKTWRKLTNGLAAAGLRAPAGPLVALAMPAAAGLPGPTAISAGLEQLGLASIGDGGLSLLSGQWLLGAAGSSTTAVATEAVIKAVVAEPRCCQYLQLELWKLVLLVKLAERRGWFESNLEYAARAVDYVAAGVIAELEVAIDRNDPEAGRVKELKELGAACLRSAGKIERLRQQADIVQSRHF
jgi:hypothetical protein